MAARRKPAAERRDASVPLGIWVLLGLLILLLAAVLIVLLMRTPAAPVSEAEPTARDVRAVRKEPEQAAAPPPPRFEFYRLLPEQSVERSTGSTAPPMPTVPAPEPAPSVDLARFEIQVGSFRNKADAERRKAEVALLGHASVVTAAQVHGQTYYRVKIGPVGSADARRIESQLRQASIEPLLIRIKP